MPSKQPIEIGRETRNSLARAVFLHRLGEIRDRTYENQQHRASGLNLVVTAIILWNTRYLERGVATLRQAAVDIPDELLAHLSPLGGQPDRRLRLGRPKKGASYWPATLDGIGRWRSSWRSRP